MTDETVESAPRLAAARAFGWVVEQHPSFQTYRGTVECWTAYHPELEDGSGSGSLSATSLRDLLDRIDDETAEACAPFGGEPVDAARLEVGGCGDLSYSLDRTTTGFRVEVYVRDERATGVTYSTEPVARAEISRALALAKIVPTPSRLLGALRGPR